MKTGRLTLILFFVHYYVSAQNYEVFYRCSNKSDSLEYVKEYQKALDTLEYGFKTVDFIPSDFVLKALDLTVKNGLNEKAYTYAKMSLINSGDQKISKQFPKKFLKSEQYKMILDSLPVFLQMYESRINQEYGAILDSIYYVDQNLIRNNEEVTGDYSIDRSKLPENLFELDQSNWILLHRLIQDYGFPSEKNVGLDRYTKSWPILVHSLRLKENQKYHKEIFSYIQMGEYLPEDVFLWYEQYNMQELKQTFFSTWDGNISVENLARIDLNQKAFYMKGIAAFELKKGGMIMDSKW